MITSKTRVRTISGMSAACLVAGSLAASAPPLLAGQYKNSPTRTRFKISVPPHSYLIFATAKTD